MRKGINHSKPTELAKKERPITKANAERSSSVLARIKDENVSGLGTF